MTRDWLSTMFAFSLSLAPLKRDTMAVDPTFRAIKAASITKRGWVTRPTAPMAYEPRAATIIMSTMETRETSTFSARAGQARPMMSSRLPERDSTSISGTLVRPLGMVYCIRKSKEGI